MLGELELKKATLELLIAEEEKRKAPDHLKIRELKKRKLHLKEQIEGIAPP